jgi:hypothetical protein
MSIEVSEKIKFQEYSFVTIPAYPIINLEDISKRKSSPFERKIDLLRSMVNTIRDAI